MDHKKLLEKIYLQLLEMDFDALTFHNHLTVDKIIQQLRDHIRASETPVDQDAPPPLPPDLQSNVLPLRPPNQSSLPVYKIMLIDDDQGTHQLLSYAFGNDANVQVVPERSPKKALTILKNERPDLLLLDIHMKEMTCFEFLSQVRLLELSNDMEIVVGSYRPGQQEKNAALELGASDYIAKPYDLSELKFKLRLKYRRKLRHA